MSFTLAQLKHAAMVADCSSFSEAARRLGVSQPTVSASVADLEVVLGRPLFRRTTRRVEATAFGRVMMPEISDVLRAADNLARLARAASDPDRKVLRVAFSPLLDIRRIAPLFAAYRLAHPDVEVIYKECDVDGLEERLVSEQVDLVCGVGISGGQDRGRCKLFDDPLHYLPPVSVDTPPNSKIELADIARQTFILTVGTCGLAPATEALFREAGYRLAEYPGRALSHATVQEWAEVGLGAGLLPASRIGGDLSRFPGVMLKGRSIELTHEAVWLKSNAGQPRLRASFQALPRVIRVLIKARVW